MNWQSSILTLSVLVLVSGCGVKGDPMPPERPADLGRGRPNYKGATQGIPVQQHKKVEKFPNEEDENGDDEKP